MGAVSRKLSPRWPTIKESSSASLSWWESSTWHTVFNQETSKTADSLTTLQRILGNGIIWMLEVATSVAKSAGPSTKTTLRSFSLWQLVTAAAGSLKMGFK